MKKFIAIILTVLITASMIPLCSISSFAEERESRILGDANLDGRVDIKDATAIQKKAAGIVSFTSYQEKLADINCSNTVDVKDATLVQKYCAAISIDYEVGKEIPEETSSTTEITTATEASSETTESTSEETTGTTEETTETETIPSVNKEAATRIVFDNSEVVLYNKSGDVVTDTSNVIVNNTYVQIVTPGDLEVSGSCDNGQLCVNIDKSLYPGESSAIEITLNGLTLTNENDSPIYIASIDDYCSLSVKKGSENTITDGEAYLNSDDDTGAIYSKDDLKIKGKGTLNVNGNCGYGICSKDDLKLWNGKINVNAKGTGIKGKDSVRIGDPDDLGVSGAYDNLKINIQSGEDGIRSNNSTDEGKGFIAVQGGSITINSQQDGMQAEQAFTINGGTINITTYKGSGYAVPNDSTAKGIKSEGTLDINDGTITVDSSDDSIHCGDEITFTGGVYTLSSGDDGIHCDNKVNVNGGDITVLKSYEGLEGYYIYINDGKININASDDGINAAGGNDGSSTSFTPGVRPGGPGGGTESSSKGYMYINGGEIFVNASGDGLDANGSITMTGGLVIVSGSENGGNGALDYDSSFTMTGGTLFATGDSGMAQNITSGTGVCSVMLSVSSISGGTLLAINDNEENNLITAKVPKKCNSIVFACADLQKGSSYKLYSGGSYSGGESLYDRYYYNGAYTPGTSLSSWTQSSVIQGSGSQGTRPW